MMPVGRIAAALAQTAELIVRPPRSNGARAAALRLQRVAAAMCRIHGFRTSVSGSLPSGPAVLVSNHGSYIDPLVIGSLVPCAPIAKAEVAAWPMIGAAMSTLGVLFVERDLAVSGAAVMRKAEKVLEAGVSVLVFPEGTTGTDRELRPFRRGMFEIARRLGAPLVPLALSYSSPAVRWIGDELFLPHYLKTAAIEELVVRVSVGAPIIPAPETPSRDLAITTRNRIRALLAGD